MVRVGERITSIPVFSRREPSKHTYTTVNISVAIFNSYFLLEERALDQE